ncbi:hypothetical protein PWT90_02025 [Aphanocladium album]|nr:hypothetical protein PWT90_02025 [Aphanocladium album]
MTVFFVAHKAASAALPSSAIFHVWTLLNGLGLEAELICILLPLFNFLPYWRWTMYLLFCLLCGLGSVIPIFTDRQWFWMSASLFIGFIAVAFFKLRRVSLKKRLQGAAFFGCLFFAGVISGLFAIVKSSPTLQAVQYFLDSIFLLCAACFFRFKHTSFEAKQRREAKERSGTRRSHVPEAKDKSATERGKSCESAISLVDKADMAKADMAEADITEADITEADITGADLMYHQYLNSTTDNPPDPAKGLDSV